MAKAAVIPFRPRLVECSADSKDLLAALLEKATRGEVAGLLVTLVLKNMEEITCATGLLGRDVDKAIGAGTRAIARLTDA